MLRQIFYLFTYVTGICVSIKIIIMTKTRCSSCIVAKFINVAGLWRITVLKYKIIQRECKQILYWKLLYLNGLYTDNLLIETYRHNLELKNSFTVVSIYIFYVCNKNFIHIFHSYVRKKISDFFFKFTNFNELRAIANHSLLSSKKR